MIDSSEKLRKIAMREVKMLKEMKHENIVHLKEAFQRFIIFKLCLFQDVGNSI